MTYYKGGILYSIVCVLIVIIMVRVAYGEEAIGTADPDYVTSKAYPTPGPGEIELEKERIKKAKDEKKVITGMSHLDVIDVMGMPDRTDTTAEGVERWYYTGLTKATIHFFNGKVLPKNRLIIKY